MPMHTCRQKSMGKLVMQVWAFLLTCLYIFVHVSVYVYMCRYVNVYEDDCFMYVHMCIYCICMYLMTK